MNTCRGNICKKNAILAALAVLLVGSAPAQDGYYYPGEALATNEMRISFMGTSFLPRLTQAANSVFVECGNGESFVFDCGSGVVEKYVAMDVSYSRMDKVFLTHLHGDHMADLMFIYCFGPSTDRKTPLHVWGPTGDTAEDGITYFCEATKDTTKWHRESFSFLSTGLTNGLDGYDLVAHECPYELIGNEVYSSNGVRITHFPAIHDRNGAISFRLEWEGISMVFSGDSQPNTFMVNQATNLDVLIHEVTLAPQVWAAKNGNMSPSLDPLYVYSVNLAKTIQDCSHTPSKAFGFMLNELDQAEAAPRLAVATHCQFQEDTTNAVMADIRSWYSGPVTLAKDLLVLNVSTDKSKPIRRRTAVVSEDAFYTSTAGYQPSEYAPPKYTNNMMQLSAWLQSHIIPEALYTNIPAGHAAEPSAGKPEAAGPASAPVALDTAPATNEMRVTFMGTSFLPRLSQAANSVFVECGNGENFVFDCGAGVVEKYVAAGAAYSQMDKILLTHLHADHMSDLIFIYCFGPSTDRFTPLYVWGPTGPGTNAPQGSQPNEGVTNFCQVTRDMTKWHRESFSFLSTGLTNGLDGYDLVAHECPYELIGNEVYSSNGVRITHFPAVHDRDGAISFRLEWEGIALVFSGDTRPNTFMLNQATNLDLLIHEVTLEPEVWAAKNTGRGPGDPLYSNAVILARTVQDCSHTPAKALGYMLRQLELGQAAPRLAAATHCQFEADTTNAVLSDIRSWYSGPVALVKDLQAITIPVDKSQPIRQGVVSFSSNAFYAHKKFYSADQLATPKYTNNLMQLSDYLLEHVIPAGAYSTLRADTDLDGDGKMDLALYNQNAGTWLASLSGSGYATARAALGGPGFGPVPGDYDWDGKTDPAVYGDEGGQWLVALSGQNYLLAADAFGGPDYQAAQGDYDGDRLADLAVYDDSRGSWYAKLSAGGYETAAISFGTPGCVAVQRDYDGDGKVDPALYQQSSGNWYVLLSGSGYAAASVVFGGPGFQPAPGDYDGDGKTDPCVYNESAGTWYATQSGFGYGTTVFAFGGPGFQPVPGDFDGDLKTDIALYQAASGRWLALLSASGYAVGAAQFGAAGDAPVWLNPAGF